MDVKLMAKPVSAEQLCGEAAAVCTNSNNYERSLIHAVESGHTSVLEHAVYTFRIDGISRAALAQLTRHRIASFDVQSQRYVRIKGKDLVIPESIKGSEFAEDVEKLMDEVMELYDEMVDAGIPCEDARYITPQAVPTELVMTMNVRELFHFLSLRCCNRAQWEIRRMADRIMRICKKESPKIFKYAGPGCVTSKCPEKKPCGQPRNSEEWEDD